jgi:FixJ family two-component response regulator
MPVRPLRIAVVDDDATVRAALRNLLAACGHDVRLFASADEILERLDDVAADCFLLDIYLTKLSGLELAARIRSERSRVPIVLMTGHDDESTKTAIARSGLPVLLKPFGEEEFLAAFGQTQAGGA